MKKQAFKNRFFKKEKAFSLLEILLVVAMITILTGIFAPAFSNLFYRNHLDIATEKVKTDLLRVQALSQAAKEDSAWGLRLDSGYLTIFSGQSYATRNPEKDESASLSGDISFSGNTEIVFIKATVRPSASSSIIVRQGNEEKIININSYGLIY